MSSIGLYEAAQALRTIREATPGYPISHLLRVIADPVNRWSVRLEYNTDAVDPRKPGVKASLDVLRTFVASTGTTIAQIEAAHHDIAARTLGATLVISSMDARKLVDQLRPTVLGIKSSQIREIRDSIRQAADSAPHRDNLMRALRADTVANKRLHAFVLHCMLAGVTESKLIQGHVIGLFAPPVIRDAKAHASFTDFCKTIDLR